MLYLLTDGLNAIGYKGSPGLSIPWLIYNLDLSHCFEPDQTFDWVMSFEVVEHLPPQFEDIFLKNLERHNSKGIILRWAIQWQEGFGHFNDITVENTLRTSATLLCLKNTLMVF